MFVIAKSGTQYAVYNKRRKRLARVKGVDAAVAFVRKMAGKSRKAVLYVNTGKHIKAYMEGDPVDAKNLDVQALQQAVRITLDGNSGEAFAYVKEIYVEKLEPVSGYIVYEVEGEDMDKAVNFVYDGKEAQFQGDPIDVEAVYVQADGQTVEDTRRPDDSEGGVLTNENEDNEEQYAKSVARFVKSQPGEVAIGGYLSVFGTAQERDLEAEYFTKNTDFWLDYYSGQPVFFHHAAGKTPDGLPEDTPRKFLVGHVKDLRVDDIGLWVDAVVTERSEWVDAVVKLIESGVLNWSSGSVSHLVRRAKDGHLWSWPVAEASLTHTPAEFRMTDAAIIREELRSVGASRALKALETSDDQAQVRLNAIDTYFATNSEDTDMDKALLRAIKAMFAVRWPSLKEDAQRLHETKSVDGTLSDLLEPMALGISDVLSADRDAVLKAVVEMAEAELDGKSSNADDPDSAVDIADEAATKAVQALVDAMPEGMRGSFATKSVNVNRNNPDDAPHTLARAIKAVAQRDRAYLAQRGSLNRAAHIKAGNIKTLGIDPDSAGGFLVAPEHSNDVIELLRTNSVFMSKRTDPNGGGEIRSLATVMPMATDTMSIPKQTGGASGAWLGESAQLTGTDPTFGQILLVAKKYGTLIKVSNELLDDASPDVDALIRDDMAADMADAVDAAVFEGTGIGNQPLGLRNYGATVTKVAINAVPTYAQLLQPLENLALANVRRDNTWSWVFNPRELTWMRQLEDTAGSLVWASGAGYGQVIAGNEPQEFLGLPYQTTTNIDIEGANNETVMYLARWRDLIIAQRKTIEIRASDVAGTSFEYDQTWIRAIMRMDIAVRHEESFELLTDVRAS